MQTESGRAGRRLKIALSLGIVISLMGFGDWIIGALRVPDYQKAVEDLSKLQPSPSLGSPSQPDATNKKVERQLDVAKAKLDYYRRLSLLGQGVLLIGLLTVLVTLLVGLRAWTGAGRPWRRSLQVF